VTQEVIDHGREEPEVTGASWRRVALVALVLVHLRWVDAIKSWIPGEWGVAAAFVIPAVFLAGWALVPLRERPRCGFKFPVSGPLSKSSDHHEHHCADDRGHDSQTHKCRCGLGLTLAEGSAMRPVPIPDEVVWPGADRIVVAGPGGDLTGPIPAVEALADVSESTGMRRLSVRCALEPGDLERLAAGEHVWVSFYGGGMPPFSVDVAP
jgi:hypothetical protein